MSAFSRALEKYSHFVSHRQKTVLLIVIAVTVAMMYGNTLVTTKYMETRDVIPEDLQVIQAFNLLESNFGSDTTLMIAVEVDPGSAGSNEPRDVRDPRVIKYMNLITEAVKTHERVATAVSAASLLKEFNGGILPQTQAEINELTSNPVFDQYIGGDYSLALVRMSLVDVENEADVKEIVLDMSDILESIEKPAGVEANVAGELAVGPQVTALVGPDISRTFQAAFIGIIIISFLIFFSIRYGITPLAVIFIGVVWAMGALGFAGIGLSAETSGTISMMMGIGIDFGIQITSRFREEVEKLAPEKAMEVTMNNVFVPMLTTTLAALIGFRAMGWGQLKFFGEFGDILTFGVVAAFLAAITIVPVILVGGEKVCSRFKKVCQAPARKIKTLFKRKKEVRK